MIFALWLLLIGNPASAESPIAIINGLDVPAGQYSEVVRLFPLSGQDPVSQTGCTATVVGPRTVLTFSDCAKTGSGKFSLNGKEYKVTLERSPQFQQKHFMGLGFTDQEITGIKFASFGKAPTINGAIKLLGYGCTKFGDPSSIGKLRIGESVVTEFDPNGFRMVSKDPAKKNAVICMGDEGGPAMVPDGDKHWVVGFSYSSNLTTVNEMIRSDASQTTDFLKAFASKNNTQICGINGFDCFGGGPVAPRCNLDASPSTVKLNNPVTLRLTEASGSGKPTSAKINGESVSVPLPTEKMIIASKLGQNTIQAEVSNTAGTNTCTASFNVTQDPPDKPSCRITLSAKTVKKGEKITVELRTDGPTQHAYLNDTEVTFPYYKTIIGPLTQNGRVTGRVTGDAGSNTCEESYVVQDEVDPTNPAFTLVPTDCGDNKLETSVKSACLAIVKKDVVIPDLRINQVILVTYKDGSKEAMPVISRRKKIMDGQTIDAIAMYTNRVVQGVSIVALDNQPGNITYLNQGGVETPTALDGKTSKGDAFSVNLTKSE